MFKWLRRRGNEGRELSAARARVEREQRALLPLASGLQGELLGEVREVERLWKEARAVEERNDEESRTQALQRYEEIAGRLSAARARVLAEHPALVAGELLARAEGLLQDVEGGALEEGCTSCEAWLHLLDGRLAAGDGAAVEACALRALALVEDEPDPAAAIVLLRSLFRAERRFGAAEWMRQGRARVVARLHGLVEEDDEEEPERESCLQALLETQADQGDLAGARATLAELTGEFREQGLILLVEAELRANELARARETAAAIAVPALRRRSEVLLVEALARGGRLEEALAGARSLSDDDSRSGALMNVAGARARAGEHAAAMALVEEIAPKWREEALLVILEEEAERSDLGAAAETAAALEEDGQNAGWARVSEARAASGDHEGALADAGRIPDPLWRARGLEQLAWARSAAGDEAGARALFAEVLGVADEVVRTGGVRFPGRVPAAWLVLATRVQAVLGNLDSARASLASFDDPAERRDGWSTVGWALGRAGDLAGLERLGEETRSTAERVWLLSGAANGIAARRPAR